MRGPPEFYDTVLPVASFIEFTPCLPNRNPNVQHSMVSRLSFIVLVSTQFTSSYNKNNRLPAALVQLGRAGDFPVTSCGRYSSQLTEQE